MFSLNQVRKWMLQLIVRFQVISILLIEIICIIEQHYVLTYAILWFEIQNPKFPEIHGISGFQLSMQMQTANKYQVKRE